jgi:predicted nuclease with TOPRIM domain
MEEPETPDSGPLHYRAACGETLTAEEQGRYDAAVSELNASERFTGLEAELRELRKELQELRARESRLVEERERLDAEIAALEARYRERSGAELPTAA